ncbi:MAG TPA: tRNA lysidine(34) synthetase TilS [Paracoccaceae bacterium]|nr:tRNA lysidine(34) synthetase TilS [Paracoccaceae bacterium]
MTATPEAALAAALAPLPEGAAIGVAVSGGGDSLALLHLAADWARGRGARIAAATVDHGLRPEAGAEAAAVAQICAGLGVPHEVLRWQGWDGRGNLQAAARDARRALLADWRARRGLDALLLGHTADDQAETFLMRLARGSGVDGLACMADTDAAAGVWRPLLSVRRAALRDWLRDRGIGWVEDPSNADARFDRVKARRMLEVLAPLGLTVERLTETAAHMQRARAALQQAAVELAARAVRAEGGDLILSAALLRPDLGEVEGRILSAAIRWIGASPYRPRRDALVEAVQALCRGEARTLAGVILQPEAGGARLTRELAAVAPPVEGAGAVVWDGRWRVAPEGAAPLVAWRAGALGEAGLAQVPDWRAGGLPRLSLLSSPAVWQGDRLISAPLVGFARGWCATLTPSFSLFLLSH